MDISHMPFATLPFGDIVKAFRKRAKMSQQQVAKQLGIHPNTVGTWERGEVLPNSIRIHISQAPLTAQNLTIITSALTELSTKYWLIAKRRFPG